MSGNKSIVSFFSMKLIKTVLEYKKREKIMVSFAYVVSADYLFKNKKDCSTSTLLSTRYCWYHVLKVYLFHFFLIQDWNINSSKFQSNERLVSKDELCCLNNLTTLLYGKPSRRQIPVLWLVLSQSGFCSTGCFLGNGPICVFLFWSKAGKFKICNQDSEKNVWKLSFFTLKLPAEARKIEIFPKFQRWMKKTNIF